MGGSAKQKSLHHLLAFVSPDIILLQETMNNTYPTLLAFSKLYPGWDFCAINSKGLSRGILLGWNPLRVRCKDFKTLVGILLKAHFRGSHTSLSILNCYGPYLNRDVFSNSATRGGLLFLPNLILAEELNLTLNVSEIWGSKAQIDPLAPFFTQLFADYNLVDVAPSCAGPT